MITVQEHADNIMKDLFDDTQLTEIDYAKHYIANFLHGTPEEDRLILIASLAMNLHKQLEYNGDFERRIHDFKITVQAQYEEIQQLKAK